jgi:hypothetical protein
MLYVKVFAHIQKVSTEFLPKRTAIPHSVTAMISTFPFQFHNYIVPFFKGR